MSHQSYPAFRKIRASQVRERLMPQPYRGTGIVIKFN